MLGNILYTAGVLGALALAHPAAAPCVLTGDGPGVQCSTLYAGQDIDAGMVCFEVVGDDLIVTYTASGDWEFT